MGWKIATGILAGVVVAGGNLFAGTQLGWLGEDEPVPETWEIQWAYSTPNWEAATAPAGSEDQITVQTGMQCSDSTVSGQVRVIVTNETGAVIGNNGSTNLGIVQGVPTDLTARFIPARNPDILARHVDAAIKAGATCVISYAVPLTKAAEFYTIDNRAIDVQSQRSHQELEEAGTIVNTTPTEDG